MGVTGKLQFSVKTPSLECLQQRFRRWSRCNTYNSYQYRYAAGYRAVITCTGHSDAGCGGAGHSDEGCGGGGCWGGAGHSDDGCGGAGHRGAEYHDAGCGGPIKTEASLQ